MCSANRTTFSPFVIMSCLEPLENTCSVRHVAAFQTPVEFQCKIFEIDFFKANYAFYVVIHIKRSTLLLRPSRIYTTNASNLDMS